MNGRRFFLDTNAIVQLLAGNREIVSILTSADYVATSVICELEFLAFPALSLNDQKLLQQLLLDIDVVDLTTEDRRLKETILEFRAMKLKLPDAIIAASATTVSSILVTADRQLLNCPDLPAQGYAPVKL
jgi:predicted nucleic acid-binding protein